MFAFLQLPIGDYSVKVERAGFKTFTEGHIHLDLDQIFNLKATMELGVVTRHGYGRGQFRSGGNHKHATGSHRYRKPDRQLPLNGRNWTQLMQLQPGVQGASDRFGTNTAGAPTPPTERKRSRIPF